MPDPGQRRLPLPGLRGGGAGGQQAAARARWPAPRSARTAQRPIVTYALIGINLALFVVTALQARSVMDLSPSNLYLHGGLIPAEVVVRGAVARWSPPGSCTAT